MLRYCFEKAYVPKTLSASKRSDLAVVDTDGCEAAVKAAVGRGVLVYGYLNIGALEDGRFYYQKFKNLRLAYYDGWDGEYWIDVTDKGWQEHILDLAKKIKACGAIGIYLDNCDVYYMCKEGFKEEHSHMLKKAPYAYKVHDVLCEMIFRIRSLGLIAMPNGGDVFLRRFMDEYPGTISTINQEGVFYSKLNKKNKSADTKYYKDWCKWAQKRISGKVRIICYVTIKSEQVKIKAYCKLHGWDVYFSKHKELRGD